MTTKIQIKSRANVEVCLDDHILHLLQEDEHLKEIGSLDKLLQHSNGYAYFQRYRGYKAQPKYETIYLHKLIAERYIPKPETDKKLFVRFIDGNVLNATIDNLEWCPMNTIRRSMKGTSSTGYRGVTPDRGRFRAVIYSGKQKYDLGFFDVAELAAKAYDRKSMELFGITEGLNFPIKD